MQQNANFMIPDKYRTIYRTKKNAEIKFSFGKEFDKNNVIGKSNLEKLFLINPSFESLEYYPFIINGESVKCSFSPEVVNSVKEPGDLDEDLFLMATPVCCYFENFSGWIYSAKNEWNSIVEKTSEDFPILKLGSIYKMAVKPIANELGSNHKTELFINKEHMLFHTCEDLVNFYNKNPSANANNDLFKENKNFTRLESWDLEFMIISIQEPFICKNVDFDQLKTTTRGGTLVQPIQIIGVDKEKIGWIPITLSRVRYGIEVVNEI